MLSAFSEGQGNAAAPKRLFLDVVELLRTKDSPCQVEKETEREGELNGGKLKINGQNATNAKSY